MELIFVRLLLSKRDQSLQMQWSVYTLSWKIAALSAVALMNFVCNVTYTIKYNFVATTVWIEMLWVNYFW